MPRPQFAPDSEGQHELVAEFNDLDGKVNVMIAGEEALFTDIDEAWFFPTERRIMRYAPIEVMLDGGKSRYQPNSTAGTMTRATSWKVCSRSGKR